MELYKKIVLFCFIILLGKPIATANPQQSIVASNSYDSLLITSRPGNDVLLRLESYLALASTDESDGKFLSTLSRRNYLNKAYSLAVETDKLDFVAQKTDHIGVVLRNAGRYNLALMFHEFALEISEKIDEKNLSSIICNNLGVVYRRIDEYDKAYDFHIRALNLAEEIKNKKSQAIAINSIGNIELSLGRLDEALGFFRQSLKIERELGNNLGVAINLNNLGNIYLIKGEYEKSIEYYRLSLEMNTKIHSQRGIAICYSDLGRVYKSMGDNDEALRYFLKALSINQNQGDRIFLSDSYINIGKIYIEEGQFDAAERHIFKGLEIAMQIGAKNNIMEANLALFEISKSRGKYKTALQYYDTYHCYKDSIMNISLQKELARLSLSFDSKRKEDMIDILEKQSEIDRLEIKKQRIINWLIVSAFILLLGAAVFLAYYLSAKNKSNRELKRKNEELDAARKKLSKFADELYDAKQEAERSNRIKSEFLANISHEIRTPLNSVLGFADVLSKKCNNQQDKEHLEAIRLSAMGLLVLINDILDLSKIEAGKITIEYKPFVIRSLFEEMKSLFVARVKKKDTELRFVIDESVPEIINFSDLRLRQIMFNLIGNAIKFTEVGLIKVVVSAVVGSSAESVNITIEVSDTGVGIPDNEQNNIFESFYQLDGENAKHGTGLGLAITQKLVEILNGSIKLESYVGKGSTFTIVFKEVEVLRNDDYLHVQSEESTEHSFFDGSGHKLVKEINIAEFESAINKVRLTEPKIFLKLEKLYKKEFVHANETKMFDSILTFSEHFGNLFNSTTDDYLKTYSANLSVLVEQFDIEGIDSCLREFDKVMKKTLEL